jgi:hypothetical protein
MAVFHQSPWEWPHESDGVCDGSTHGGKKMVHSMTYAPMPQHIDFRLQIALSALLGVYLWYTDVANAFAEADYPEQI